MFQTACAAAAARKATPRPTGARPGFSPGPSPGTGQTVTFPFYEGLNAATASTPAAPDTVNTDKYDLYMWSPGPLSSYLSVFSLIYLRLQYYAWFTLYALSVLQVTYRT